ncbi:MAG TPA: alpha/beta hydrolase [Maritimibacter sp.]|nr:alpha/beta hydrolase [Maritimibacter sp.]
MLKTIVIVLAIILAGVGIYVLIKKREARKLARMAEASCPPQGDFVTISTGRLHYVEAGSGPSVIFVHGLGGQLRSLSMTLLKPLSERYRVVFIDRPGMGWSERPESASARIDDQAGYVEEVIDALDLGPTIVVGHSLGGAIASALALRAPGKVAGLALLAPLLRPSSMQPTSFGALGVTKPGVRRFIAHTFAGPTSVRNQDVVRDEIFGPDPVPKAYTTLGGGLLSLRPKSFINTSRDYCAVPEVIGAQWKHYDEITCPVRVLYGTEDRILNWREQGVEMSERFRHFKLKTVEGAGHMLPLTKVDEVVALIDEVAGAAKA